MRKDEQDAADVQGDDEAEMGAPTSQATEGTSAPSGSKVSWEKVRFVLGVVGIASAALSAAWGGHRYVVTSDRFACRSIVVDGPASRTPEAIAALAGVSIGDNLFAIDYGAAEAKLLADPFIAEASIERRLPGTVKIHVKEQEAKALLVVDGELIAMTLDGVPFKRIDGTDALDLPVLTGIGVQEWADDRPGAEAKVRDMLGVLEEVERSSLAKSHPLQEIHLSPDGSIQLFVGRDGIMLRLGEPPHALKLEQAARSLQEVERRRAKAVAVFADSATRPERVVVRLGK